LNGPLHVAVSGAGGLVGGALCRALAAEGHRVLRLVRRPSEHDAEVFWDPFAGQIDATRLEGVHAMVHLAGENVAAGRWNATRKTRIRTSRVDGTTLIARTLAGLKRRPTVLVNASAIGYYGDRGDERLDETSPPGTGFLAETCLAWEDSVEDARSAGLRVPLLRIGVVLDADGGALQRMLTPFRLGLGGRIGNGRQFMSWIALADLVRVIRRAIDDDTLDGPINAVAPHPLRNREFTRVMGRVLRRPTPFPLPAWAVRLLMGEMGRELLLASSRVLPARLQSIDFAFLHEDPESALRSILGRP
jgi:uncharacterized protein (TIGR01777 family)